MLSFLQKVYKGSKPQLNEFILALGSNFNLLHNLKETPQDPQWHAEGDVFIHTELVLQEIYKLLAGEASHLNEQKRFLLILAAVFHDIAKPLTTRREIIVDREHTISPRHADRGRSYLAYRLLDVGIAEERARAIMALVGHHHDPKKLVLKDAPLSSYRRLARLVNLELLYYLEKADILGRECQDKNDQLEILEFFRLQLEEYNLWQITNPYAAWQEVIYHSLISESDLNKQYALSYAIADSETGLIFTPEEALARTFEKRQRFPELFVLYGPSGAGKSTWIERNLPNYKVISLDDLRVLIAGKRGDQSKNGEVIQAAKEKLKEHLRQKQKVVWDATNLRYIHRNKVLQLGFDYHALVKLVIFHYPSKHFFMQNKNRENAVSTEVLTKQIEQAEFPYEYEAHQVIYLP